MAEVVQANSGQTSGSETVTFSFKKDDIWKYSTFILGAILIIGAFVFFNSDNSNTGTGNVANNPSAGDTAPSTVKASVDNDAMLGSADAKVTIIEFSDYQCPFCRKFWTETYSQVKTQYIDTGKVNLVFRDFPLTSIHPMAQKSAEAAECVKEKGGDKAYFEMHDKMFEEQNILDSGNKDGPVTKTASYTTDDLKAWAKEIGYDISSCLDSGKYTSEVQKDTQDATASGGRGTPYFVIINADGVGTPVSGAVPFSSFQSALEAALAA